VSARDRLRHLPGILYRCFDADDRLLYVGVTTNPNVRMDLHRRTGRSPWWVDVERVEHTIYADRVDALLAERAATLTEAPLHPSQVTGSSARSSARAGVLADLRMLDRRSPREQVRALASQIVAESGYDDDTFMTPGSPGLTESEHRAIADALITRRRAS